MSIVLLGSTSGSITLQEPAVAGSTTINLPATSGTALVAPTALTVPNTTGTVMVSGNMPAFSAYRNSNQTISASTFTKIQFNLENFDTANCFDATTNYRFTPNVAGYYQVNAQVRIRGTSGDNKILVIYKNGSQYQSMDYFSISAVEYLPITASAIIYLNGSTDYIEAYAYSNGTNTTVLGESGTIATTMSACLVRAA